MSTVGSTVCVWYNNIASVLSLSVNDLVLVVCSRLFHKRVVKCMYFTAVPAVFYFRHQHEQNEKMVMSLPTQWEMVQRSSAGCTKWWVHSVLFSQFVTKPVHTFVHSWVTCILCSYRIQWKWMLWLSVSVLCRYAGLQTILFTARRYASAVYAVVVCLSVCLSVRHKPALYQYG